MAPLRYAMQEIADMYNVFGYYVRKAVKTVFKDGILKEQAPQGQPAKQQQSGSKVFHRS